MAAKGDYRLTESLRDRTVGMVGLGRIGKAIARRLDAMRVPVVYHTPRPQPDVPYRHYPSLLDMARDADVLLVITPGGAATRNLINAGGAGGARTERHPDQHGARLGGRRAGADQGVAARQILTAGLDVFAERAEGAGGADRDGPRRAVPACRLGVDRTRAARWSNSWSTTWSPGTPASRR